MLNFFSETKNATVYTPALKYWKMRPQGGLLSLGLEGWGKHSKLKNNELDGKVECLQWFTNSVTIDGCLVGITAPPNSSCSVAPAYTTACTQKPAS